MDLTMLKQFEVVYKGLQVYSTYMVQNCSLWPPSVT
jgi:hypothetical protein